MQLLSIETERFRQGAVSSFKFGDPLHWFVCRVHIDIVPSDGERGENGRALLSWGCVEDQGRSE